MPVGAALAANAVQPAVDMFKSIRGHGRSHRRHSLRVALCWCVLPTVMLLLSACATAPKTASQPQALPDAGNVRSAGLAQSHRRSPYAPAQEDVSKRGDYVRGGLYAPHIKDSAPDDPLHDVDLIPEPEVVDAPRSRYGNRSPYQVLGKSYAVLDSPKDYVETGLASYYGNKFHGRRTSNLEVYDMYSFTAAHKTLPLPSFARVTNLDNGNSVVVRVNDRGPFHDGRVIDLSYAAAVKLGYRNIGTARVEVRGLSPGENAREPYDAIAKASAAPPARASAAGLLPAGVRIATGKPTRVSSGAATVTAMTPASTAIDKLVGLLPIASANAGEPRARTGVSAGSAGTSATVNVPAGSAPAPTPAKPGREWRFDMQQDGKAMSADEFDAWMKSRRARVATGVAGKPDPRVASVPTPQVAAATVAAELPKESGQVTLQVASFGNSTNAGHAVDMLRKADITARIQNALVNGKPFWRVRVGPLEAARAPDIAARVVAMGFDQPHRVRE